MVNKGWTVGPGSWSRLAKERVEAWRVLARPTPMDQIDLKDHVDAARRILVLEGSAFSSDPDLKRLRREFKTLYPDLIPGMDLFPVDDATPERYTRLINMDGTVCLATTRYYRRHGGVLRPAEAKAAGWTHYALAHK